MTRDHEERRGSPAAGEVPNEEEVAREFPHGTSAPLREQRPLIDEDGDDIRQYTGEPVETEDGTVLPQQMVVGSERVVGGGEFPNTPGRSDSDEDDAEAKGDVDVAANAVTDDHHASEGRVSTGDGAADDAAPQMTDPQENYLHTLAAQAGETPPDPGLTTDEAAEEIRRLQAITGRDDD